MDSSPQTVVLEASSVAVEPRRFLSAEELIAHALPPRFEEVEIKDAGWVRVAAMSTEARDAFEDMVNVEVMAPDASGEIVAQRKFTRRGFRAKLLHATLVNVDGSPMFTEAEVDALLHCRAGALEPAVNAALRLNGFSKQDEDELVGKSGGVPGAASSSGFATRS